MKFETLVIFILLSIVGVGAFLIRNPAVEEVDCRPIIIEKIIEVEEEVSLPLAP